MGDYITIGIGQSAVAKEPGDVLKTFALGSCVAFVLFCPKTGIVGMAHIALPKSDTDPAKAQQTPAYFADTGIPDLLRKMRMAGCLSPLRDLTAKIAGGAAVIHFSNDVFNIGSRNVQQVKAICEKVRISITAADVGGSISRTVSAAAGKTNISINCPGIGTWEL